MGIFSIVREKALVDTFSGYCKQTPPTCLPVLADVLVALVAPHPALQPQAGAGPRHGAAAAAVLGQGVLTSVSGAGVSGKVGLCLSRKTYF